MTAHFRGYEGENVELRADLGVTNFRVAECPNLMEIAISGDDLVNIEIHNCPRLVTRAEEFAVTCPNLEHVRIHTDAGYIEMWDRATAPQVAAPVPRAQPVYDWTQPLTVGEQYEQEYEAPHRRPVTEAEVELMLADEETSEESSSSSEDMEDRVKYYANLYANMEEDTGYDSM